MIGSTLSRKGAMHVCNPCGSVDPGLICPETDTTMRLGKRYTGKNWRRRAARERRFEPRNASDCGNSSTCGSN
jgi:hypothetical protein